MGEASEFGWDAAWLRSSRGSARTPVHGGSGREGGRGWDAGNAKWAGVCPKAVGPDTGHWVGCMAELDFSPRERGPWNVEQGIRV